MKSRGMVVLVVLGLLLVPMAAGAYDGSAWLVTNTQAQNASPSSFVGLGTPNVTFTTPAINFTSISGGNDSAFFTVGSWLTHGGATIVTGSAGNLATIMSDQSVNVNKGTLMQFTGTAFFTNGQAFTIAHDDGVVAIVGGLTLINQPGITAPEVTTGTYTGPTGNQAFTFYYGECQTAPAVFQTTLIPSQQVPEPVTLVFLGLGLLGVAAARKRLK